VDITLGKPEGEVILDKLSAELDKTGEFGEKGYEELSEVPHAITTKAVLIGEVWVPKSQLKIDRNRRLYVKEWFFAEYFC